MAEYKGSVKGVFGAVGSAAAGAAIVAVCGGISGAIVWAIFALLDGMVRGVDPIGSFFFGLYLGVAAGLFTGAPTGIVLSIMFKAVMARKSFGGATCQDSRIVFVLICGLAGAVVGTVVGMIMLVYEGTIVSQIGFAEWTHSEIRKLVVGTIHTALGGGTGGVFLALRAQRRRLGGKQKAAS